MLVILTFASDESCNCCHIPEGTGDLRGKLFQTHYPWDSFALPHDSCTGNSCMSLSSISCFAKLEMFAITDGGWLQQGVANVMLHSVKLCSLSQVGNKIFLSFVTSQTERHLKSGVHKCSKYPGPTSMF
jgi:hypothetical protein